MRLMRYLTLLVILVLGISFAVLNPGEMTLNYWFASKTLPMSLFSVIIFALGCATGLLLAAGLFVTARMETWRLERRLKVAEKEIRNLRVIPIQGRTG